MNIAIVGGGISGLVTAFRLTEHGIPFRLPPAEIDRLAAAIHRHFKFSPDAEK